jgi:hypothetical protein
MVGIISTNSVGFRQDVTGIMRRRISGKLKRRAPDRGEKGVRETLGP